MMRQRSWAVLCLILAGCAGPSKVPPTPRPSVKEPARLNKTFGEAMINSGILQTLSYKEIGISIDPPSASGQIDYILLTQSVSGLPGFPKNQKVLAPGSAVADLVKQGYTSVKGLSNGRMMQLTKNGGFVFARAVEGKSSSGAAVNGYLLEFDNGRNIFISGPNVDVDSDRQFLYALRDEGKEIHLAFIPSTLEQSKLVDLIALLQPEVTVLTGPSIDKSQLMALRKSLQEQLYEGSLFSARSSDTFPF